MSLAVISQLLFQLLVYSSFPCFALSFQAPHSLLWNPRGTADDSHQPLHALRNTNPLRAAPESIEEVSVSLSSSLLVSLRERTPLQRSEESSQPPLDLATDFYDPSTGLHSEGVWHNALAGIASLRVLAETEQTPGLERGAEYDEHEDGAKRIADSMWKSSWDGMSFRRRAHSGRWDHSALDDPERAPEQANYYKKSEEHRCVQHGMATVFWSLLVRRHSSESDYGRRCRRQYDRIASSFLEQFWDDKVGRWRTISRVQGGGTIHRRSASSDKPSNVGDDDTNPDGGVYYRAVDQALGIFACLGMLRVLEQRGQQGKEQYAELIQLIGVTSEDLLSSTGFGYGNSDDDARSYIGINRNRNFWHEGWVLLALISARQYVWPEAGDQKPGEDQLRALFSGLVSRYGRMVPNASGSGEQFDGTVWHWATSQKKDTESGNVRYCGDNALLYAITRGMEWAPGGDSKVESAFLDFQRELRRLDLPDGALASVADVYPQVRLHPNTELAALVVWQARDF